MKIPSAQLFMRRDTLENLPPLALPAGFSLHNERKGDEKAWETLIERAFGMPFSYEETIRGMKGYRPEGVLFVTRNGREIATAAAVENDWFPGEGWLHMVGGDPDARGCGAGRLVCLATLHFMAAHGYQSAVLSTDDFRIPAIAIYRALGFRPLLVGEDNASRWKKVDEILAQKKAP